MNPIQSLEGSLLATDEALAKLACQEEHKEWATALQHSLQMMQEVRTINEDLRKENKKLNDNFEEACENNERLRKEKKDLNAKVVELQHMADMLAQVNIRLQNEKDEQFYSQASDTFSALATGIDGLVQAEKMKQSKEASVQKMKVALKEKQKAEKELRGATAKAETLADAQFNSDRARERVQELEAEAELSKVAMANLHRQIDDMAEEMRCMTDLMAEYKKQYEALSIDKAWLFAGQIAYSIAARMAQREGKRASDADTFEAYWTNPDTRAILEANGLDEDAAKALVFAKQSRTHVAHPSTIPTDGSVSLMMKKLVLKEKQEADILRGLTCLKMLNTRLCERETSDMSSN
jgi:hypothetical protein